MKIIIDARLYGLENAGIGRYVMNLVMELQKLDKKNDYTLLLRKKYFNQLKCKARWQKVLFDHRHYGWAEQVRLPKLIKSLKPDLVHFPHFNVPVSYGGKYVVTIHDLLMHRQKGKEATTLNFGVYLAKRLGYKKVFGSAINKSSAIIVPSNYVKDDLVNYYGIDGEKIFVTYEGVDKRIGTRNNGELVVEKYKLNKDYFIYAGSAYPHKNLKRAIEAVIFLNERYKKQGEEKTVLLAIVTSRGVFSKRLEKLVEEMGARKYVRILGFVPDEDLGSLYCHSVGFLYPSLSEGFGLPGLEAMASGSVALVSEIVVFKEIYKDKAIYFNPYDFSSIERAMKDVVEMSGQKRSKMIGEGKRFVKRYSWEKMAKETLNVYEKAVG
jgi:glycosyltransferase involved in cell wall biosynthesis